MLDTWTGDHEGYPRFDLAKTADLKDALMKGMDLKRAQINVITGQDSNPTFENSIAAFEDCGRPLNNANRFFDIYTSTMNDKTMQSIETEMKPVLSKFDDEVIQNDPLFQRLKAVYEVREKSNLTPEQQRLTAGSFYDRKTCDRFRETIFCVGNSVPPDVAFRNFRGRDVDTNALCVIADFR